MTLIPKQEHSRVMASCVDVPQEQPSFPLPLDQVGISGKTVWVDLPQGRLPFAAQITVDLEAGKRGIHMSRMEEVVASLFNRPFPDLRSYALELGRQVMDRQGSTVGSVSLAGRMPLVRKTAVSERSSLDTVDISAEAGFTRENSAMAAEVMIGAGVNHITACPCTQVYNEALFNRATGACPMPTHSQRSHTSLMVTATDRGPTCEELLACLDEALHVTRDLLKRPDEAEIVLKAHHEPQFAEDAVRETARQAGIRFGKTLPAPTRLRIESLSLESIHIHDVRCCLSTTLAEILALLK
jgi:GTP cyclohydrolase FolE2